MDGFDSEPFWMCFWSYKLSTSQHIDGMLPSLNLRAKAPKSWCLFSYFFHLLERLGRFFQGQTGWLLVLGSIFQVMFSQDFGESSEFGAERKPPSWNHRWQSGFGLTPSR